MNDRELTALLRMAHQAESLEGAHSPRVTIRASGRRWLLPGFVAAAATVALAALTWMAVSRPVRPAPHKQNVVVIHDPLPSNTTVGTDASVVLAVFQAGDGDCQCVVRRDVQPVAAGASKADLIAAALSDMCMNDAERVLVIGLTGPLSDLPRTHEAAQAIVQCMPDAADDHAIRDALAARCVPSSVSVTASTVALARR